MNQDTISTRPAESPESSYNGWRARRLKELSAPESWLGVIGLHWLEPGSNRVGSDAASAVSLPAGPDHVGDLTWEDEFLIWRSVVPEVAEVKGAVKREDDLVFLQTDRSGEPSRLQMGNLLLTVIERGGRLAVRVRNLDWRGTLPFAGVECYPFDPAWRIEARWEKLPEPFALDVQDVTGEMKTVVVSHRATFRREEGEYALLPLEVADDGIFFVFRDATSGRETYGGGRFLRAKGAREGRVVLDFNRAFNPPCAFTAFATCSLPPPENWLPLAIRAGEKKYTGDH